MKKIIVMLLALVAVAQVAAQNFSYNYYTPDQHPTNNALWVDNITFTDQKTVVALQYVAGNTSGINLLPSTKLIVRLKGNRQYMLELKKVEGIPMGPQRTQSNNGVVIFRAYFQPIPLGDIKKLKSVDFIEVSSNNFNASYFNVYNIRISDKNVVIR